MERAGSPRRHLYPGVRLANYCRLRHHIPVGWLWNIIIIIGVAVLVLVIVVEDEYPLSSLDCGKLQTTHNKYNRPLTRKMTTSFTGAVAKPALQSVPFHLHIHQPNVSIISFRKILPSSRIKYELFL
ncbi:hypothetical protein PV325_006565 [Microctonus aethiopoides]|nr:hypothetical protein PV325_006565 [Microctonus aethiopoides]KAK0095168.1 hypothetical protein PV326_009057 [Microctonus aethiopoides]